MAEEQEKAKKPSKTSATVLRLKKFVATKGASSKMGQAAILHYLGDAGKHLAEALKEAATICLSEKESKELMTDIFVLSCKAKVLHDAKRITDQDKTEFANPINNMSLAFWRSLEASRKGEQVDIVNLSLKIAQLEAQVVKLLSMHVKAKNIDRAARVFGYFGSTEFLSALLQDNKLRGTMNTFYKYLTAIMTERLELEDLLPPPKICRHPKCTQVAAQEEGKFKGSLYCYQHHHQQYKGLVANPSIHHFLDENGLSCRPIQAKLCASLPPNCASFYAAIHNYQRAPERVRRVFAEGIREKYLDEKQDTYLECLSDKCRQGLETKSADEHLFDEAKAELLALLQPLFTSQVLGTQEYAEYIAGAAPP
mmetsp:Transcript_13089/g.25363  ORF Transcript_13089/g.25363 Transcript_13089/m.25363 type:complete len:367 (-) Transcript_13089:116-1216(-)